ncbi:MAG TPA: hypothetical protein VI815_03530 [Candidatus Nanoarchaeia archaeon]|nr:hypothetical protein [Candidatus Nanoarchaeia archaeon]
MEKEDNSIQRNEDYGFFYYLLGHDDHLYKQTVSAMKHYAIAWGFFRLNEDKVVMDSIDRILRTSIDDWKQLEQVHDYGYMVAQKSCMVDNLINSLLGKKSVYIY